MEDQRGINTACTFCGCTPWFFYSVVSILNRFSSKMHFVSFLFSPLNLMASTHRLTILPWHEGSCTAGFLSFPFFLAVAVRINQLWKMTVFDVIDGERSIMFPEELRRVVEKQCLSTLLSSKRLFVTLDQVSKERAPENGGYNLTSVS